MAKLQAVDPISDEDTGALPVKNIAPATAFYEAVLGFSVIGRDSSTATLMRDEVRIGLIRTVDHEPGRAGSVAEAQRGIGRYRPCAMHDLIDPARWHADVVSKPVLR